MYFTVQWFTNLFKHVTSILVLKLGGQTICHMHANSQNMKNLARFAIPPNNFIFVPPCWRN